MFEFKTLSLIRLLTQVIRDTQTLPINAPCLLRQLLERSSSSQSIRLNDTYMVPLADLQQDETLSQLFAQFFEPQKPNKKTKKQEKLEKPKKSQSPIQSLEERQSADVDPSKCLCRIWKPVLVLDENGNLKSTGKSYDSIQCSSASVEDGFCSSHAKKISEHGPWWLGYVNEPRPEEPFGPDKNPRRHYWSDQTQPEKMKRSKESKKEKKEKTVEKPSENEVSKNEEVSIEAHQNEDNNGSISSPTPVVDPDQDQDQDQQPETENVEKSQEDNSQELDKDENNYNGNIEVPDILSSSEEEDSDDDEDGI